MKAAIFIFISLLMAGCRATQPAPVAERETVTVTETIRDTVVTVQPDASVMRALPECNEDRLVVVKELPEWQSGKHTKPPVITVKENILTAAAEVDSFSIYLHRKQRDRVTDKIETVTIATNELTGWQWFQVWSGQIAWLIVLFIITKVIINQKFKIKN